jgi:hypothetical protein
VNLATFNIQTLNIHIPSPGVLLNSVEPLAMAMSQATAIFKDRFEVIDGGMVIDHRLQLMWPVDESEKEMDHDGREKYASEFRLGGFTNWRQADRWELVSLCPSDKYNPAINTEIFRSHGGWVGTRETCPWSPGRVFVVLFNYGLVYSDVRDGEAFCRPVRSLVSGQ